MKYKKNRGKYFPMNATGHVTEKLTKIFSTFKVLFVALEEVHFFICISK